MTVSYKMSTERTTDVATTFLTPIPATTVAKSRILETHLHIQLISLGAV